VIVQYLRNGIATCGVEGDPQKYTTNSLNLYPGRFEETLDSFRLSVKLRHAANKRLKEVQIFVEITYFSLSKDLIFGGGIYIIACLYTEGYRYFAI